MKENNSNKNLELKQSYEFLILLILLGLLCAIYFKISRILYIPLGFTILGLLKPYWIHPAYRGWMKLAHGISRAMNSVILGLAFFLIVLPVALIKKSQFRAKFGLDTNSEETKSSAFINRAHTFSKKDFHQPF